MIAIVIVLLHNSALMVKTVKCTSGHMEAVCM